MPTCPNCGVRMRLGTLFNSDLRHVLCAECPAVMSVSTRAGMLPAIMLILMGPPVAKAVQEGWFSIPTGIAGGVVALLIGAWIGYARSTTELLRLRYEGALEHSVE